MSPSPIDDDLLAQRWRHFYRDVRATSSGLAARLLGPLLGDDTRRRRLVNQRRSRGHEVSAKWLDDDQPFPFGYVASPVPHQFVAPEHVTIVAVDDDISISDFVRRVNDAAQLGSPWILVVSSSTEWTQHHGVARQLLDVAAGADVVFADEIGPNPKRPILKPDIIGPHTLLSYNVVGRPALVRTQWIHDLGGLRLEAGVACEHDLFLRMLEAGAVFRHLPRVLPGRATSGWRDALVDDDTQRVVRAALARRNVAGDVVASGRPGVVHWRLAPYNSPTVDIVIPTRDRRDLLERCITSLEQVTAYPHYSIIILDNDSVEPTTQDFFEQSPHRVIACPGEFNYAAIINRGVAHCTGDFVVTLNNDTIITQPDWLDQMVGVAQLDNVAIVGVALVDPNGVHEHDGIVVAPYPQHLRLGVNYPVHDDFASARRDVTAVTGAVQLFARRRYEDLGGMDEELRVVMNDVDLCLRAQADGAYVVFLPDVVVTHQASSTRGRLDPLLDRNRFVRRWDVFGSLSDPFFSTHQRLLGDRIVYRDWQD